MLENFSNADSSKTINYSRFSGFLDFSEKKESDVNHKNDLAGIERGREMTFTEADSGNVNPYYEESEGFQNNCNRQFSCIFPK